MFSAPGAEVGLAGPWAVSTSKGFGAMETVLAAGAKSDVMLGCMLSKMVLQHGFV